MIMYKILHELVCSAHHFDPHVTSIGPKKMTRRWGDSTGASTGVYPHCFGGKNPPKKYMCLAKLFISSAKSQLTFYSPNLLGAPQIGGQTGRPSNNFPISNHWHLLLWLCSLSCQRVTHEMFLNIYIYNISISDEYGNSCWLIGKIQANFKMMGSELSQLLSVQRSLGRTSSLYCLSLLSKDVQIICGVPIIVFCFGTKSLAEWCPVNGYKYFHFYIYIHII